MKTDTQKTLPQLIESLGVTVESTYQGVQREPGDKKTGEPGWLHFAFRVTVKRAGRSAALETPYRMGVGHVKLPAAPSSEMSWAVGDRAKAENILDTLRRGKRIKPEYEREERAIYDAAARKQGLAPKPADVLHSLLADGEAFFDGLTFEYWCANLGYDTDSRKAEAMYRACDDTGRRLARMFSPDELAQLREAASDY